MEDTFSAPMDQALEALKASQATVLQAVRTWADSVNKAMPESPTMPLADSLPDPVDLVDQAFDVANEVLQAQRSFTHDLVEAVTPLLPGRKQPAAKKPAK